MSPTPNWSPQGRASGDLLSRHAHAPKSAAKIYRHKAWQPIAGIGHPLLLRLKHRLGYIKGPEKVKLAALPLPPSPTPNWTPRRIASEPAL